MAAWNWYYNHIEGWVKQLSGGEAALVNYTWLGWHGPFTSQQAAIQFYNDNKAAHPSWQAPAESALKQAVDTVGNAVTSEVKTVKTAATDPFNVNQKIADLENWFIRGAEIALGIVLIAVGLSHLSGGGGIVGTAFKVGKSTAKLIK